MILLTNTAHQTLYQQAAHRWQLLWRGVLSFSFALQAVIAGFALHQYHQVSTTLQPLRIKAQHNRDHVITLKHMKSVIAAYDAASEQRESNQRKVEAMYERLADFHAVNLRLLRIKPNYIYCGIEDISETAVQQYQAYLKKMHYKPVSQQLIEKIWFLEFVRHDNP